MPLLHIAVLLGSLKSTVVLISKVRKTKKLAASRKAENQKVVLEGSSQAVPPRVRQEFITSVAAQKAMDST